MFYGEMMRVVTHICKPWNAIIACSIFKNSFCAAQPHIKQATSLHLLVSSVNNQQPHPS